MSASLPGISRKMERTEVSELYYKKAPRIISRNRLRFANTSAKKEKGCVKNDCEVDDEVGEEFVVRGGVMMRIADVSNEQWKPMKRFYIDVNRSQIYQHAEVKDGTIPDDEANSSRVAVELSPPSDDGRMFHVCDNLPGVANEVESYPCPYCPNRIFLTSFGLERHTEIEHKTHLPEVMEEISRIHNEWRRREAFKAIVKKRREALKKTRMLADLVRGSQCLRFEDLPTNNDASALSCRICGLDFESNCEFMMDHLRAHRKNDDLRKRLLTNFGPSYVARCTCHQCHLVFVNEKNLMLHKESSHIRKRKYVCKWCGNVCLSVNELNEHKKDVHGVPCNKTEKSSANSVINNSQKNVAKAGVITADGNSLEKQTLFGNSFADTSSRNRTLMLNQNPCITKCSECGLTTVKPSLLIRHMQRVHNKDSFSALIEVKGSPNIRVDMDRGQVTWWCCNFSFEDRHRFIHHRKTYHQPVFEYNNVQNCSVNTGEQVNTLHETKDRDFISTGQIVQLINHNEAHGDELYVLLAEDNSEQRGEAVLQEMRRDESVVESAQQITVTAREFMQLRQQVGENFDGSVQILFVDDSSDTQQQPSPNSGMEPAIDFRANSTVDNDVLNSLLISSTQMPDADDKYYSGAHLSESEFSVLSVSDSTEDKILQNVLPVSSESLASVKMSSSGLSMPTMTISRSGLVDNAPNCHFQVQGTTFNELISVPAVTIPHSEQQFDVNVADSSTALCPELDEVSRSTVETSSSIMIINNDTVSSPSIISYCFMKDPRTSSLLLDASNRLTPVVDSITTLLHLDRKCNDSSKESTS